MRGLEVKRYQRAINQRVSRHVRGLEVFGFLSVWRQFVSRHVRGLEVVRVVRTGAR